MNRMTYNHEFDKRYHVVNIRTRRPKLKCPSPFFAYIQGFVNGRTGTAALDPRTGVVQSGYIRASHALYHCYCSQMWQSLSVTVTSCYSDLAELLHAYRQAENTRKATASGSPETLRAEMAACDQESTAVSDMIRLYALLCQAVDRYNATVASAASRISRSLAHYCKGVMFRKPLHTENLPSLKVIPCDLTHDFSEMAPIIDELRHVILYVPAKEAEDDQSSAV